jgi:hypothetical protein
MWKIHFSCIYQCSYRYFQSLKKEYEQFHRENLFNYGAKMLGGNDKNSFYLLSLLRERIFSKLFIYRVVPKSLP